MDTFLTKRQPFSEAWKDLRNLERAFALFALGLVLLLAGAKFLGHAIPATKGPSPILVATILIAVAAGGAWMLRAVFVCPRCRKFFFLRRFWANTFSSRCLHCSLQRGSPDEDVYAASPDATPP